ncbi:MAG: Mg/Co/Ni transporter MgtE [Methanomassiliicoccales archaeon]|nr:Mg/Co/Ni transporter MgtE [Methanomassiliicoccales archaeon]NYT14724.1 Mg/Co/Ni transporter MgtE [Methanomassiliicoccales archaeon]
MTECGRMAARRRVREFVSRNKSVFRLGLAALTISSLADLLAGITLGYMTGTLELLPGLIVLIPAAIGMRGNIFGAVGSRLGTALHIGTFELSLKKGSVLRQNLQSSLLLTMFMSFIMGILAKLVSDAVGADSASLASFVFISVIGGVLAGLVLVFINLLVAYVGYKREWDIDNISAPIITAAGDIVTLPMLFIAAIIVLNLGDIGLSTIVDMAVLAMLAITVLLAIYALRSRDREVRTVLKESSPVLIFCILLDLGAGLAIDNQLTSLVALPALLVLVPPFLEEANALGGILTSRMSSLLHMGLMEPKKAPSKIALENFAILYIFSLWVFVIVGVFTHIVSLAVGFASPGLVEMVLLSLTAGICTVTVLNILSYYVAVSTFRFSLNPDNLSIPLTSSTIDLVGSIFLMAFLVVLGLS